MAKIPDVLEMFASLRPLNLGNSPWTADTTEAEEDAVAAVWADLLDDIDPQDLKVATKKFAQNGTYWPKPAEIRKLCPTVTRKQLESASAKESGVGWFSKVVARAGSFGPNSTGAMEHVKGTLATYQKGADPWGTGRTGIIRDVADGNPAITVALAAGIDAVGWREFHGEGWKYKENKMREVFDRAFSVAMDKYTLDHPEYNVIDFQERKRIAAQGTW